MIVILLDLKGEPYIMSIYANKTYEKMQNTLLTLKALHKKQQIYNRYIWSYKEVSLSSQKPKLGLMGYYQKHSF